MNRSLVAPAVCSLIAFGLLLATIQGATGRATKDAFAKRGAPETLIDSQWTQIEGRLLSNNEAHELLLTLADEYARPWRQWEESPHRLYSRAAPYEIPAILVKIVMAPSERQSESFALGTIAVNAGSRSQPIPCIVDRLTKGIQLFADGEWLSESEWLTRAPSPGGFYKLRTGADRGYVPHLSETDARS